MLLFEPLKIKFENEVIWAMSLELALIDTILESHPEFIGMFSSDVMQCSKNNQFGRGDKPSVEQIVRFGLYKEIKGLDYRELELAQIDSRICAEFVKIDPLRPYSFQVLQKNKRRQHSSRDKYSLSDQIIRWFGIAFTKAIGY
jgi:IS5 family transposase